MVVPAKDIFFENYNCRLILTKGGYFKKLSMQGMRATDEQKLKEGDYVIYQEDTDNRGDILFFTDKAQIYRAKVDDFEITKPSQMGDYVPAKLEMDENERVIGCKMIYSIVPEDHIIYIFENGKGIRLPMSVYDAKTRRKKITGAYSDASPLAGVIYDDGHGVNFFIRSDGGRGMVINASSMEIKSSRKGAGYQVMNLPKKGVKIDLVTDRLDDLGKDVMKCKKSSIPSSGTILSHLNLKF